MIIEHPEWMSTHTHHSPDLYKGEDRGRIYRITPETGLALPANIRLGQASDEELVTQLGNSNIWWRRTAQRLLMDRHGPGAVPALAKLVESSPSALARLHALWTLEGLHQLDPKLIEKALSDAEPGVRENAIVLAESRPSLSEKLVRMESDPNPRVQFQLLCTLGGMNSAPARAATDRLLARNIEDRWMQIAALSAGSGRALSLFEAGSAFTAKQSEARVAYFRQVAEVIGARRNPNEIRRVLETLVRSNAGEPSWWRAATLDGLAQGLSGRPRRDLGQDLLLKLFESPDAEVRHAALRVLGATGLPANANWVAQKAAQRAASVAAQSDADAGLRADSIGLLALENPGAHEQLFESFINPQQPEPVQAAAARALGRVKGGAVGTFLIDHWRAMTPAVRLE